MRNFHELSEREILALAISSEKEDGRIYTDFAERLGSDFPARSRVFNEMAREESEHRRVLLDLYVKKFGEHLVLVRKRDVRGFVTRKPVWQSTTLGMDVVRKQAASMEAEAANFYRQAMGRSTDTTSRKLLGDLAEVEARHEVAFDRLMEKNVTESVKDSEDDIERPNYVLRIVQPALAGLMDGSVSTLAAVVAAVFATGNTWDAFLIGMAASIGAGISMGFAEALSGNGLLTGRGTPWVRGGISGLATTVGGVGHTLPFLIANFDTAVTVAICVVVAELAVITLFRCKFMDSPPFSATLQANFGGALVFATGILFGGG